jgi:spermidine/putrescine transport system substrate-binding protein
MDMLHELDHSLLPNLRHIDPFILEKSVWDPDMTFSVPYYWGAAGIAVNTARVPDFIPCISIFSRTDLAGRMTMLDDLREVIGEALSWLGYSVNTTNAAEIAEARDFINREWRPNLAKFCATAFGKSFANGDFWVVHGYHDAIWYEIQDDPFMLDNTVFFIPPTGTAYLDAMVILRNARNVELAHEFINFIHRPEIYAYFVDTFRSPASVNMAARELKVKGQMHSVEDLMGRELKNDLGPYIDLYTDAWFNHIRFMQ